MSSDWNRPALAVRHLTKQYGEFGLEDVSFDLPRGYVLGLIGPNGAGKSTTVKLIIGALRRTEGNVRIFGIDPEVDETGARSRIGVVHEDPPIDPGLTVNSYGRMLRLFHPGWCEDRFSVLVRRFELPFDARVGTLSRGNRTKVSIAGALASNPDLLILDEPTTGLDPIFRRELLDELRELVSSQTVSILFSTHLTSDLERIADFIVLLHAGRSVLNASMEELRDTWRIVRGGQAALTSEVRANLHSIRHGPFGFTGLTDRPDLLEGSSALVIESIDLDELVVSWEERSDA